MAADAKVLDEDPETGAKKFRYIRTGEDHFSLAFTYAWLAATSSAAWVRREFQPGDCPLDPAKLAAGPDPAAVLPQRMGGRISPLCQ